jgi:hypothetical protein
MFVNTNMGINFVKLNSLEIRDFRNCEKWMQIFQAICLFVLVCFAAAAS